MEKNEVYDFIGELAIALYSKNIKISLNALNEILADRSAKYGNNRGLGAGVSAAYRYWKKDPVIHHAIAFTYLDKDGESAWNKQATI